MPAAGIGTLSASWIATWLVILSAVVTLVLSPSISVSAEAQSRTLVAVFAHGDDELSVAPILARYAREGVDVYLIIATDGAQGGTNTEVPRGPELAGVRMQEARCATDALGIQPPILLGFPDGKLGDHAADPSTLYRLTARIAEELERLRPTAVITWGPDGGTGHSDHRLVSAIVTQLARAGAPGVPERIFYMNLPVESFRAMNPQRGEPPLLIPQSKYFSVQVPFTDADLRAARQVMECHRTQFPEATVQRVFPVMSQAWNGRVPLIPAFSTGGEGTDLLR